MYVIFLSRFFKQIPYVNDHDSLSDLAHVAGRLERLHLQTQSPYTSCLSIRTWMFLALLLFTGMC